MLSAAAQYLTQWIAGKLELSLSTAYFLSMAATAPIIGKVALGARDGDLAAGFFSGWDGGALAAYLAVASQRKVLQFSAADYLGLGRVLLDANRFTDAAWAYASSAQRGGDPVKVQKGLISAADGARRTGKVDEAVRIYQFVIQQAPGSPNAQYCEGVLKTLKDRAKKPGSG